MLDRYGWSELFPPHIWQRGLDYYLEGHVLNISRQGSRFDAQIKGNEIYDVSVTLSIGLNQIEDYSCDCPYGEDGTPCKHLAALLCALMEDDETVGAIDEKGPDREQIVGMLSEKQMRELLLQLARHEPRIWEKIHLTATRQLPSMQKQRWEQDLWALTRSAADRHGYIDYEEADGYCNALEEYMDDRLPDLLTSGLIMEAFELVCLVFQTGTEQDMDDSGGSLSLLSNSCMDEWSSILEAAAPQAQEKMLHWFKSICSRHDLAETYLEDYIYEAPWKPEIAPEILELVDQRIQECLNDKAQERMLDYLAAQRIHWMEKAGMDRRTREGYIANYHHLPAVREIEIAQARKSGDWARAVALLEESKELDKDRMGLAAKHSGQLIEIFETMHDTSALRKELAYHLLTFRQESLDYVEKLKALLSAAEWEDMRNRLLNSTSMRQQIYPLLAKENLLGELMHRIEANRDIYALGRYEPLLKKEFPRRCQDFYIAFVRQAMEQASNRKQYRAVIQVLKRLTKYPDGKASAQALADSWKREYRRRSSMLDELRKAGF